MANKKKNTNKIKFKKRTVANVGTKDKNSNIRVQEILSQAGSQEEQMSKREVEALAKARKRNVFGVNADVVLNEPGSSETVVYSREEWLPAIITSEEVVLDVNVQEPIKEKMVMVEVEEALNIAELKAPMPAVIIEKEYVESQGFDKKKLIPFIVIGIVCIVIGIVILVF